MKLHFKLCGCGRMFNSHRKGAKQALCDAAAAVHSEEGNPPAPQETGALLPKGSGSLLREMSTLQRKLFKAQIIEGGETSRFLEKLMFLPLNPAQSINFRQNDDLIT